MGRLLSRNRLVLLAALFGTGLFSTGPAGTQERLGKSADETAQKIRHVIDVNGSRETGPEFLARRLSHFRAIGDIENAARVFRLLFPEEEALDPLVSYKLSGSPSPGRIDGPGVEDKPLPWPAEDIPVFVSPENERNPSVDVDPGSGHPLIFIAAEQWAGGLPNAIILKSSADLGETWPSALLLGDDSPLTSPMLRRISEDSIGIAFTKSWHPADHDVYFARISTDLETIRVVPVDCGLIDESSPSLTSDVAAYPLPYVYVVYSENSGSSHRIKLRVSPDLGETWSRAVTVGAFSAPRPVDCRPSIAFDPHDSSLLVAFAAWQGNSEGIAISRSRSFGASWSDPAFITPPDSLTDGFPKVAAQEGTAIVAYEHHASPSDLDIQAAFSSSGGSVWIGGVPLAAGAGEERRPDLRVAGEPGTARMYVSYVRDGTRVIARWCDVGDPESWSEDIDLKIDPNIIEAGSVALALPITGSEELSAAVTWSERNPDSDVYFNAERLQTLSLATLAVTPDARNVTYPAGTTTFAVEKTGAGQVNWTAAVTVGGAWLSIQSGASGTNAGTIVAAYLENQGMTARAGTIRVTSDDPTIPPIDVSVVQAGAPELTVTPADGLVSTGEVGGPFIPASLSYTLQNTGGSDFGWTATSTQAWVTVSPAGGILTPGAAASLTISINSGADALAAGTYADTITITNTANGQGSTTRPVSLTVEPPPATLSVIPATGLDSTGPVGGPFVPGGVSYTLGNIGVTALDWTAASSGTWLTLSPTGGSLAPGETAILTGSINDAANLLAAGTYSETIDIANVTNGRGNTSRPVSLTAVPPGAMTVTPATGFSSNGIAGGPFTPASAVYTLGNTGETGIDWTATNAQTWLTVEPTGGALAPGGTTTVTATINANADALTPGTYNDTITFTNTTNGIGNADRPVTLTVEPPPGVLTVTPGTGLVSSGIVGGPFTPPDAVYTLANTGGVALNWTAANAQPWLTLTPAGGALGPGETTIVTATINGNANDLPAGTHNDTITFANTTNGDGNTTRPVTLTIAPPGALEVTPATGLTSSGIAGGPFTPASADYTLRNSGGGDIAWTAANTQPWLTLSAASGTLPPGETTTVTVTINANANVLAPGIYSDTVTFTNTTNGRGTTTRPALLTVLAPGALSVAPTSSFSTSGIVGGPFTPAGTTYTLQNTGAEDISWTALKSQLWLTLSAGSGSLAPGGSTTVTATINAVANSLMAGSYSDTIAFTNTTNGNGNTNRAVTLTVNPTPGALSVSPAEGLSSSGFRGGPFTPSSVAYTLTNGGGVTVSWTASRTQSWVTLSAASGTLSPGASTTLIVSLNSGVNALAAGTHADTVTITNTTNGAGNTTRPVALTVIPLPALSVSPANRDVTATAGTTTFSVSNSGGGTFDWTAQVISGGGWLTLQAGANGTDNGTITAAFVTNPGLSPRQGTIRVSAAGATGSPVEVTVTQAGGYLDLSLAGQRLVEKAWIIEREYGRLVLTVEGSPSVIVDRFVIYRKIGDQAERVLSEVPGSSIQGGTLIYNDTFLEKGTNYTYHIVALDSLGAVLRESNSIVI